MGLFSGVRSAKVLDNSTYLGTGHYLARIDKIKQGETRKSVKFLAVEMTIIHLLPSQEQPMHFVGQEVSRLSMKTSDYFDADVAGFITGIMGCTQEEITEEVAEWLCNEDPNRKFASGEPMTVQPMKGAVVEVSGKLKMTKANNPFTAIKFHREVPAEEVIRTVPPEMVARFFPKGPTGVNMLEAKIAAEAAAKLQASTPAA